MNYDEFVIMEGSLLLKEESHRNFYYLEDRKQKYQELFGVTTLIVCKMPIVSIYDKSTLDFHTFLTFLKIS